MYLHAELQLHVHSIDNDSPDPDQIMDEDETGKWTSVSEWLAPMQCDMQLQMKEATLSCGAT